MRMTATDALKLKEKVKRSKHLSVVAAPILVKKQKNEPIDQVMIDEVVATIAPISAEISQDSIDAQITNIKAKLKQRGVKVTDEIILRELACDLKRIDEITDYKNLLWDPKQNVVSKHTSFTNKFMSSISPLGKLNDFEIKKVKNGTGPIVIVINGFLNQGETDSKDWEYAIAKTKHKNSPVYVVNWDSGNLASIVKSAMASNTIGFNSIVLKGAFSFAALSLGATTGGIGPFAAYAATHTASNIATSWYSALYKTEKVGSALSYILQCTNNKEGVVLMGHSLGARVVYHMLKDLAEVKKGNILECHLLGGAVSACDKKQSWSKVVKNIDLQLYNYYSTNDDTLSYLYRISTGEVTAPIGLGGINSQSSKIRNIDLTSTVSGHSDFKRKFT